MTAEVTEQLVAALQAFSEQATGAHVPVVHDRAMSEGASRIVVHAHGGSVEDAIVVTVSLLDSRAGSVEIACICNPWSRAWDSWRINAIGVSEKYHELIRSICGPPTTWLGTFEVAFR